MILDKERFFNIQRSMYFIPYEQTEGWHNYQAFLRKSECIYFVDDENQPNICAWGLIRVIPIIGRILQIYGDSYNEGIARSHINFFYDEIVQYSENRFIFVYISNSSLYDINYEMAIRQAGFIRPLLLIMCPLSIMVDLDCINTHQTWKRRMKEAQKHNLKFQYIAEPNMEHISLVVQMYSELSSLKKLGYTLDENSLRILLNSSFFKLFIVYTSDDRPLMARIVYVRNNFSYDIIAANSSASREIRGSSYYMVNSILDWLKNNNVKRFDFGRIGPGKRSTNSVYEFKSYIGSPEVSYNGEWVYSKHKIMERIIYFLLSFKYSRY
jgi:hypothetical protein